MLDLRPVPLDHPDVQVMIDELQAFYAERYGDGDATELRPHEFVAPGGYFAIGCVDGAAVACGGWRAREGGGPGLRDGDAEIKRMYVRAGHRGRGYARQLLAHLEDTAAAAGRRRLVLETGTRQPEAIALYESEGYAPMEGFGLYRDEPDSRYYARSLPVDRRAAVGRRDAAGRWSGAPVAPGGGSAPRGE